MLKNLLKTPYYYIKNLQYNKQTFQIMKRLLRVDSNCIDIGCHTGKMLDWMIELSPEGTHWGFEPLPDLFLNLKTKYANQKIIILPYALSDTDGQATFKHVKNSPGYSGFKKRTYHIPFPNIEEIIVSKTSLDNIIHAAIKVDLIKIDVEGAELEVLRGAEETIKNNHPYIIFEHGLGAALHYGTKPEHVFDFLTQCQMKIYTFQAWLNEKPNLDRVRFFEQFYKDKNYYFIACPDNNK